ncbi:hypothetical protein GH733_013439 [Mirounga leonina]|nr:hypothetical protein GH733_013439 [Mirounga leonina]
MSCVPFAHHVGPTCVETKHLPQGWEEISHNIQKDDYLWLNTVEQWCLTFLQKFSIPWFFQCCNKCKENTRHIWYKKLSSKSLKDYLIQHIKCLYHPMLPRLQSYQLQSYLTPTLWNKTEKLLRKGDKRRENWMYINSTNVSIIGRGEHLAVLLQLYDYLLEYEDSTEWESLLQVTVATIYRNHWQN